MMTILPTVLNKITVRLSTIPPMLLPIQQSQSRLDLLIIQMMSRTYKSSFGTDEALRREQELEQIRRNQENVVVGQVLGVANNEDDDEEKARDGWFQQ